MSFSEFIDIIINSFYSTFNGLIKTAELIYENNWFKLIFFITLLFVVIEYFGDILSLIRNVFSMKKEASKNKVKNSTDIE